MACLDTPSEILIEKYVPLRPVTQFGINLLAHQSSDLFSFWELWEQEKGKQCEPPFWAITWPGGIALTHFISANTGLVDGKSVLDFGCGGGITAIAASIHGARKVIANDIDEVALEISSRNAAANGAVIQTDSHDYTRTELPEDIDLIFVGDLFYEKKHAEYMLPMLLRASRAHIGVYIADGQRNFAPREGFELVEELSVPVDKEVEGASVKSVRILKLL